MQFNNNDSGSSLQSEINITPLVDVVLVLLIIFMVVVPLLMEGYDVDIPRASADTSTPVAESQLILSIGSAACPIFTPPAGERSEEHTSELQSPYDLVCRLLLEKKKRQSAQSLSDHLQPL